MNLIVMPAYNEEASIGKVIREIADIMDRANLQCRYLIIDDGSFDRTPEILKELDKTINLHVERHERNMGIHKVFDTGLRLVNRFSSDQDTVVFLESDDTNDPKIIPEMVELVGNGYDLVVASRFVDGGMFLGFPAWRKAGCWVVNRMLQRLIPAGGVTDYTIFYRAYSARLIQELFHRYGEDLLSLEGFVANAEILAKIACLKPKVAEVPLKYNYFQKKSPSRLNVLFTSAQYLRLIYRYSMGATRHGQKL